MKKKVSVNQDLCISCSTCWVLDPNHFAQGDDGKAKVKNGPDDNNLATSKIVDDGADADDAAASCPVGAITIEEEEE